MGVPVSIWGTGFTKECGVILTSPGPVKGGVLEVAFTILYGMRPIATGYCSVPSSVMRKEDSTATKRKVRFKPVSGPNGSFVVHATDIMFDGKWLSRHLGVDISERQDVLRATK